jgi:hypothetical protein
LLFRSSNSSDTNKTEAYQDLLCKKPDFTDDKYPFLSYNPVSYYRFLIKEWGWGREKCGWGRGGGEGGADGRGL